VLLWSTAVLKSINKFKRAEYHSFLIHIKNIGKKNLFLFLNFSRRDIFNLDLSEGGLQ
jgi:hypothetical protein